MLKAVIKGILNWRIAAILLSRFHRRIERGVKISRTAQILGWRNLRIRNGTILSDDVCINVNLRDTSAGITIGRHVFVGHGSFFSTGGGITIGDFSLIGRACHFLNAGHTTNPLLPYIASGIDFYPPMKIGINVWLTNQVTLIGGISVGFGAVVASGSVVTRDIPPLSQAMGNPANVTKLYNWKNREWKYVDPTSPLDQQIERHLLDCPSEAEYREHLVKNHCEWPSPSKAMGASQGDIY